ncbi:prefoldin subunit 6-like protein [Sarcoptes scabiei]|uniref:Prefoldin subunit 6-like protein n=1 Tax=Sarcoptes scabiei TaxID=52283 RepID=A0A132AA83_SARSC|nr:prefoldin subunit 6-like protein [Sarcoptes scabiei]
MEMKKFNDQYQKFQESRNQIKKLIGQRGQLEVQLNENKIVKEELELLDDNVRTFKLIGPALMKIDLKEAKDNVNNRIKYINQELYVSSVKISYGTLIYLIYFSPENVTNRASKL